MPNEVLKRPPVKGTGPWVQVDRKALETWGKLAMENPGAAKLLATIVAKMERGNAVVASHQTLAEIEGCSTATIKRRLAVLKAKKWLEVRQIGGSGTANSYIVNERVAWYGSTQGRRHATFQATVLVSESEQVDSIDDTAPLEQIPTVFAGENLLPMGNGLPPPSEPALPGLEVNLPARQGGGGDFPE